MAAKKRTDEGSSPASDGRSKKVKMEEDDTGMPTLQSTVGMMDGPDDTFITTLFSPLFYAIIGFATTYFKGKPYNTPRKSEHKALFETLTGGDYKDYLTLKHPGAKERIVQAAVWNKLVEMLLQTPLRAFASIPVALIEKHISDSPQFYAWRAMTAQFLFANYKGPTPWGKGGARREAFVQETTDLLFNLAVIEERNPLENDLDGIAEHAYQLATAMARSGADWVCALHDPRIGKILGTRIKSDRMEDVELWDEEESSSRSLVVDLVAAPMLLKYGNSRGQNFGACRVFKKAEVVMKAAKKAKKGTV